MSTEIEVDSDQFVVKANWVGIGQNTSGDADISVIVFGENGIIPLCMSLDTAQRLANQILDTLKKVA